MSGTNSTKTSVQPLAFATGLWHSLADGQDMYGRACPALTDWRLHSSTIQSEAMEIGEAWPE